MIMIMIIIIIIVIIIINVVYTVGLNRVSTTRLCLHTPDCQLDHTRRWANSHAFGMHACALLASVLQLAENKTSH